MDSNARGQVVEEARLLISVGADANAKDSQGRTAADIAAAMVKLEIVSLLKDVK
jgi:ankyrin repeat protein